MEDVTQLVSDATCFYLTLEAAVLLCSAQQSSYPAAAGLRPGCVRNLTGVKHLAKLLWEFARCGKT